MLITNTNIQTLQFGLPNVIADSNSIGTMNFGGFSNATNNNQTITNSNETFSVTEDEIPSSIIQQASQMPLHSKDVTFLNLEERIHGFSGMYIDQNGTLNIYTTDNSVNSISHSTLGNFVDPQYITKGVIIKHSNHSWHKWMELETILLKLFDNKTLGITSMGADDKNQVYDIGFEKLNDSNVNAVNEFLAAHDIPQDMTSFVETGKIIPLGGGTGSNFTPGPTIQPLVGGAQIGISPSYGSCTLGFIATRSNGQTVGITAGHCVNGTNQKYTQPYSSNPSDYTSHAIGSVIAGTDPSPPRYSDTLLFTPSAPVILGKIYDGGPQLTIGAKDYNPIQGQTVYGFGSSYGTNQWTIKQTGITFDDPGLGGFVYSQVLLNINNLPIFGDSGGPVWKIDSYGNVLLSGTLVGFDSDNGGGIIYSPISGIEFDQSDTLAVRPPPPILLSPNNGPVGQPVQVIGVNFLNRAQITITLAGNQYLGGTDSNGNLYTSIQIPSLSTGQYPITVSDNYNTVSSTFTVNTQSLNSPNLSISPNNGLVGQTIYISAINFKANSVVTSKFGTSTLPSFTTGSGGYFSATFTVPSLSSGTYTINSTDGSNSATSTFQITGQNTCVPPSSGDWVLSSGCTLSSSVTVPGNVIIESGTVLTIPSGTTLTIHFGSYHLLVYPGGQVFIASTGKLSS
jgi:hypothetical protein